MYIVSCQRVYRFIDSSINPCHNDFMNILLPIMIVIAIIAVLATIIITIFYSENGKKTNGKKDKNSIIKSATKKLSQDPHNTAGLFSLAELYFEEHNWEKAISFYKTLVDIASAHPEINLTESELRYGICAVNLQNGAEAFNSLVDVRKKDPENFEANYYLGQALLLEKKYDKAIPFLQKARSINPAVEELYEKTGIAMYYSKMYKRSIPYLKRALDINPESKELLFFLAVSLNNTNNGDRALKIFMHLRSDPVFGSRSSLAAGVLHKNTGDIDKAISDFTIGLKHTDAPLDEKSILMYNLSQGYIQKGDLANALVLLEKLQSVSPNYKDVPMLITRYKELNKNKALQIYSIGGATDFLALCRQIVLIYYKNAHVKVVSIDQKNDILEIQTAVETAKWEDTVVFHFSRTTGSVGELFVREFHGAIRDYRAGRGVFVSAGKFSNEALKFVEGRPIDLIEKESLLKLLSKVNASSVFTI